jgi:tetratricopeptide (TPR) repeat protein
MLSQRPPDLVTLPRRAAFELGDTHDRPHPGTPRRATTAVTRSEPDLFPTALRHHKAGRLDQAEGLYNRILAHDPAHADSLHLLGVIACQRERYPTAINLSRRAIALHDNVVTYHTNLAIALHKQGEIDAAITHYERALALGPDDAGLHDTLDGVLYAHARLTESVAHDRHTSALQTDNARALQFGVGAARPARPRRSGGGIPMRRRAYAGCP